MEPQASGAHAGTGLETKHSYRSGANQEDLATRWPQPGARPASSNEAAAAKGGWSADEVTGLCKMIDVCGGRIESVDLGMATFLVPTRSKQACAIKLKVQRSSTTTLLLAVRSSLSPPPTHTHCPLHRDAAHCSQRSHGC